jgi:hypothetical protein
MHPSLDAHALRRVSVAAKCDPRAVVRYLYGESQTSLAVLRVEDALRECQLEALVAPPDERKRRSAAEADKPTRRPSSAPMTASATIAIGRAQRA